MAPDDYQKAWQEHNARTELKVVDADLLLQEVQRSQIEFRRRILARDYVEIGLAIVMVPIWIFLGIKSSLPWTWYLTIPALLWVAGFLSVQRIRHKKGPMDGDENLIDYVKNSVGEMDQQIWLLRNVFWWYLLPPTLSIFAFFGQVTWESSDDWRDALTHAPAFLVVIGLYGFIYYINQRAVDVQLEPRRQELLNMVSSLTDEGDSTLLVPDSLAERAPLATKKRFGSRRRFGIASFLLFVVAVLLMTMPWDEGAGKSRKATTRNRNESLKSMVSSLREEHNLVGLAAMVMVDGEVREVAADGVRKARNKTAIDVRDRWHLTGITKSVTATMVARLVESGVMNWTDTVGDYFDDAVLDESWKAVTIRQLLTDTSGAPANFPPEVLKELRKRGTESTVARQEAAAWAVSQPLRSPSGSKRLYSNLGYTIVGAMAELAAGETWEQLVRREVFEPLELTEVGFGPPKSSDDNLEQPRGHRVRGSIKIAVSDEVENSPIMSPAAAVHMSLDNLCRFANEHMRGDRGQGKLLSAESYELLHTPEQQSVACGWVRQNQALGVHCTAFWHNGCNGMWYSFVVFVPKLNTVVAVVANDGDLAQAEATAWEIAKAQVVFPKKSPFAAIRWSQDQPEVQVGGDWLKLESINQLPAEELVAFCKENYRGVWRKRFEEDLVEVLTLMGSPPQDNVDLVLRSLATNEVVERPGVPMTEENRSVIRNVNENRSQ